MRGLICLFSLVLVTGAAQGSSLALASETAGDVTYYVDVNGNDANSGYLGSPWKTMHHAAKEVVAGDTVLINPGVYSVSQQIDRQLHRLQVSNPIMS